MGIRSLVYCGNRLFLDKKDQIALALFLKERITLFRSFCIERRAKEQILNPAEARHTIELFAMIFELKRIRH